MNSSQLSQLIANRADAFLTGVHSRLEARTSIAEYLSQHYVDLEDGLRKSVIDGVMSALEDQNFFDQKGPPGNEGADRD